MFRKSYKVEADLSGSTALITGANAGIGRETAKALARCGADVYLACRSSERAQSAIERITAELSAEGKADAGKLLHFLKLDLADLQSVKQCAEEFLAAKPSLDLLILNAGFSPTVGNKVSSAGIEDSFQTCHVSHFYLTSLLFDALKKGFSEQKKGRVVVVSSAAHTAVKEIDYAALAKPDTSSTFKQIKAYATSKFANALFTQELDRRLKAANIPVLTAALHPGVVHTEIWRNNPFFNWIGGFVMLTETKGALTTLYCATSPELENGSGAFYDNCSKASYNKACTPEKGAELWAKSLEWCKIPEWLPPASAAK